MDAQSSLTSDFVDDQVHLPIGALAQLTDDVIVFTDVQLLQVLSSNQLEFLQDINGGAAAVRRGAHCCGGTGWGQGPVWRRVFLRNKRSRKERGSAHEDSESRPGVVQP